MKQALTVKIEAEGDYLVAHIPEFNVHRQAPNWDVLWERLKEAVEVSLPDEEAW